MSSFVKKIFNVFKKKNVIEKIWVSFFNNHAFETKFKRYWSQNLSKVIVNLKLKKFASSHWKILLLTSWYYHQIPYIKATEIYVVTCFYLLHVYTFWTLHLKCQLVFDKIKCFPSLLSGLTWLSSIIYRAKWYVFK